MMPTGDKEVQGYEVQCVWACGQWGTVGNGLQGYRAHGQWGHRGQ